MEITPLAKLESLLQRVQHNRAQSRTRTEANTGASVATQQERPVVDGTATLHGLPAQPGYEPIAPKPAPIAEMRKNDAPKAAPVHIPAQPAEAAPVAPPVAAAAPIAAAASGNGAAERHAIVSDTPTLTGAPTFAEATTPARRTFQALLEGSLGLRLKK